MSKPVARVFCILVLAGIASACGRDATPERNEEAVRKRAAQWWTARQQRDHDVMYQLYEPTYRSRVDKAQFLRESLVRTRFDILTHEIREVRWETPTRAKVEILFTFLHPPAGGALPGRVEETWVFRDGNWFKEHQPIQPPFPRTGESLN